ncbi:Thiol-disulfide isomerase or thioredoxin [Marivirga sericea]|uniref:Thiol-disulfide isomerase or thioredoxin n=1 Tax=Marivirga sericea TaxID=1028 RepID=A0A1X7L4I1_9BACT|nr:TlpA disulfide reductase family protein [Marivirga sericea]SMG47989.1 Thiol-disulfide isomerase or thioredoxin [Marivirga sericea]
MRKIIVGIVILALTFLTSNIYAQKTIKAQKRLIGGKIEKIEFTDYIENTPDSKEFNKKFKVLEFWATWCKPCLEAVPHLNELKSAFNDEDDLVFLSVTYEAPEKTQKVLERIKFETIVVSDQTKKIHNDLNIEYKGMMILPRTVLIDNSNKIIWYGTPTELSAEIIRKFLKNEKI